jgi:hypothetical protein
MNIILTTLLIMISCDNSTNENSVTFCKTAPDSIGIEYLDSTSGIDRVETVTDRDTLTLVIKVSPTVKNEGKVITFRKNIKYLKMGSRLVRISDVQPCREIRSGDDALKNLKNLK